jgi:hypothetical protein
MNQESLPGTISLIDRFSAWANKEYMFESAATKLMKDLEIPQRLGLSDPEFIYMFFELAKYNEAKTGKAISDYARKFRDGPINRIPVLRTVVRLYTSYDQARRARGEELAEQARLVAEDYGLNPSRRGYLTRIANMVTTNYWDDETYEPVGTLEKRRARFEEILHIVE